MVTGLLVVAVTLFVIAVVLLLVIMLRKPEAAFGDRVRAEVDRLSETLRHELHVGRSENGNAARQLREELTATVRADADSLQQRLNENTQQQIAQLQVVVQALQESSERSEIRLVEMRSTLDGRLTQAAAATQKSDAQTRQELQTSLKSFSEVLAGQFHGLKQQLGDLTVSNEKKLEAMRSTVETKLAQLQADNEAKLERIRLTVDEKLHQTLEQRLGDAFRSVSERLELVHSGLGEMKTLAVGVGDLKKILNNVKSRGTWGEVQLGNLLEQTLTSAQYVRNFAPNEDSAERVEFAIKLPGRDSDGNPVWLPIDSKFPQEDYQRLVDAQERGDVPAVELASNALEQSIRSEARKISEKYLRPPTTTDFAILFLPTESLFAEILRRPGLSEALQRDHRVVVSGPTTITALLTSLQMGFRTLAIEQRSSEVWKVLGAVKTEFGKFGEALDKVHRKLNEASSSIEAAQVRSRAVVRKLKPADELPVPEAAAMLGFVGVTEWDQPESDAADEDDS